MPPVISVIKSGPPARRSAQGTESIKLCGDSALMKLPVIFFRPSEIITGNLIGGIHS